VAGAGCGSGNSGEVGSSGNAAPCAGCGAVSLAASASSTASSADVAAHYTRQEDTARTISQPPMPGNAPALADLSRSRPYGAAHRPFTKDSLIRNFTSIPDVSGGADCSAGSPRSLGIPPDSA
jgi:hypothetical protein